MVRCFRPGSRSGRRLATLRRLAEQRPRRSLPPQVCKSCGRERRLGRLGDDKDSWSFHCEPCWQHWEFEQKHWYLEDHKPRRCTKCNHSDRPGWSGDGAWYCHPCWNEWFEELEEVADIPRETSVKSQHFDFVEVGTSNWNTFTQVVAKHPSGKDYAWNFLPKDKHPEDINGLAIDMKPEYLAQLPDLPRVKKVCAAVAECNERRFMQHVPIEALGKWEKIFATSGSLRGWSALQTAHGCSSLGKHRVLRKQLGRVGLMHLIRRRRVRTHSLGTLLDRHKVGSIGMLALDCEGYDCAILRGLMRSCESHPQWYPCWIQFESNGMNDELFGRGTEEQTIEALKNTGYELLWGGAGKWDTVMGREFDVN